MEVSEKVRLPQPDGARRSASPVWVGSSRIQLGVLTSASHELGCETWNVCRLPPRSPMNPRPRLHSFEYLRPVICFSTNVGWQPGALYREASQILFQVHWEEKHSHTSIDAMCDRAGGAVPNSDLNVVRQCAEIYRNFTYV